VAHVEAQLQPVARGGRGSVSDRLGRFKRFREFADFVKERAAALGISVRWGGDFKTIGDFDHWELTDNGIGGSDGTGSSNA
jgi:hypothetical protein